MVQDNMAWGDGSALSAEAAADQESKRRRQKLLGLLRGRYHWAIIAALILGLIGGVGSYFIEGDEYAATGRVELRAELPTIWGGTEDSPPRQWETFVITKMGLVRHPQVITHAINSEVWRKASQAAGITYTPIEFAKAVSIDKAGKSNYLDISFTDANPQVALAGLDAVMTAYLTVYEQLESEGEAQVLKIQTELRDKETSYLEQLRNRRIAVAGELGSEPLRIRYETQLTEVVKIESELASVQNQLDGPSTNLDYATMPELELRAMDGGLAQLDAMRQSKQQEIDSHKLNGFPDNHYLVRRLNNDLQMLHQQYADRLAQLRAKVIIPDGRGTGSTMDADALRIHKTRLEAQLTGLKADSERVGRQLKQVEDIELEIARVEEKLRTINGRIENLNAKGLIPSRLAFISGGQLPEEPSNAKDRIKMAVFGGGMGAFLGIGLIMLIGALDPRLRHIDDAAVDLPHARMLGILPTLPADLNDPEQAVLVAHSVHHIRTLLQIGREQSGNIFSVTSPSPGSGKTSLTMALGLSFAASGSKTLLIDADIVGGGLTRRMGFVVHPRLGQVLRAQGLITEPQIIEALRVAQNTGVKLGEALVQLGYVTAADVEAALDHQHEQSIGLLEACGEHRFEECVAPTGIRNLYILPIGTALPQQAGALSPTALRRVIASARSQFDTILLDTGPLLGSLEACMAASEADATVLIVSRGDQKPLVMKTIEHLQAVNGRLSGVVFNHALATDIERSTYGSVTMSQSRHPNNMARVEVIDADTSARFGPLATAVASYAAGAPGPTSTLQRRTPVAAGNGNGAKHNGNGKHANNGHGH